MNPSELTRKDEEMRSRLVYFLARLSVAYEFKMYPMTMFNSHNSIPAGAIYLPLIDTKIHCLVPRRRRP